MRDKWASALRSRLAGDGGPYGLLDPAALNEAEELFSHTTDPRDIPETCHLVGLLHWRRAELLADERGQGELDIAIPLLLALNESRSRLPLPGSVQAVLPPDVLMPEESDTSWRRLVLLFGSWLENRGNPHILRLAVSAVRNAVRGTRVGQPERVDHLCFLVAVLHDLFEHTGDLAALEEAVRAGTLAAAEARTAEERATSLNGLAVCLRARYERTNEFQSLEQAVVASRHALSATREGGAKRATLLNELGICLRLLYDRGGDPALLDEAVRISSEAVETMPEDLPAFAIALVNHGNALRARFERTGDQSLLNRAIAATRRAADVAPPRSPLWRSCLYSVGLMLETQFQQTGDLPALLEAIDVGRVVAAGTPQGHGDTALHQSGLAVKLRELFARTRDLTALDEAIAFGRAAAETVPHGHPHRGLYLTNLAAALKAKAAVSGDLQVLRQAIGCLRLAADVASGPHRVVALTNMTGALSAYFDETGETAALEEAIAAGRRALAEAPGGASYRALCHLNLAAALSTRGQVAGDDRQVEEAIGLLEAAAATEDARPALRVEAGRGAGRLAMLLGRAERAADAYALAVRLLPRLAARGLDRADASHWMAEYGRLAGDAAACAVAAGRAEEAVELLETGRGVLLAQSMDARTDLTDLRERDAGLADRFAYLCGRLDADESADESAGGRAGGSAGEGAGERTPGRPDVRRELAEELTTLIARIRTLPGLERFLLPLETARLLEEAREGPIVLINVSEYRCDALILASAGVRVQELPGLTLTEIHDRLAEMREALDRRSFARRDRQRAEQVMLTTLAWLWDTVTGPVLQGLGILGGPDEGRDHPRIWWVPCGALAYFPLHAAGHHLDEPGAGRRTVIDRVASSYSATVRGLLHARGRAARHVAGRPEMLVVAMPRTPEASDLEGARREFDEITGLFPAMDGLVGEEATHDAVVSRLAASDWVHFACHAVTDPADPSGSRLLLHDHASRPLTVLEISRLRLDRCAFAYLSACDTAVTVPELADECVHAVTAFQVAGYPHVVGTLWKIDDATAAEIAGKVYEDLASNGSDPARAGLCLHRATRVIRDRYPRLPTLWAAHVHMGA
ncbi:CHAT domain-containing protein [Microbispora triticiradicis]|uniref:CHAT domain-containing protein n=1 Tax=Microbispora triticiradicis TaxID=2200763 RepID=UPI001AD610E8|nr:CHAT domain-containing protein [Microbispora triticiradicis]MBO4273127.1 CHAT domain-containing protein [Microbispora triticiradicis]